MDIQKVGVVGCGLMGSGIAEVAAKANFDVVVREVSDELIKAGRDRIQKSLDRAVEKGKLTVADRDAVWSRLRFSTELPDLADRHLVIEAIVEEVGAKNELFSALDGLCGPETIFASNTSSLTITDMAAATGRPDRVVGLHFFNPVPVMELVEVVRTMATSDEVFSTAVFVCRGAGQEADHCEGQLGLRSEPTPGALHARRHPATRAGCGLDGGYRSSDDPRSGTSHGSAYSLRLRRGRYGLSDLADHVRRVPGGPVCASSPFEADRLDGAIGQEDGKRVLRLVRGSADSFAALTLCPQGAEVG